MFLPKPTQLRTAEATGHILLSEETIRLISDNHLKKGDVLTVAEIAGIQGGKRDIRAYPPMPSPEYNETGGQGPSDETGVRIDSLARCTGKTGIEMEALTAVSIALLTIYDMCKSADKTMKIDEIRLMSKKKEDI